MIIDFHIHTHYSYDSFMKPSKIIKAAKKKGLTGIVICDHNTIKGGIEAKSINKDPNFNVIVGAEIATDAGDITGLFLTKEIISRDFVSVAREIKNQNGFVLLNHPFKGHNLSKIDFEYIDFIEGYNARVNKTNNEKAIQLAKIYNKPIVAGSDAHFYSEIGKCKTIYDSQEFNLASALKFEYNKTKYIQIAKSQYIKALKNKSITLLINITIVSLKKLIRFF